MTDTTTVAVTRIPPKLTCVRQGCRSTVEGGKGITPEALRDAAERAGWSPNLVCPVHS